MKSAGGTATLDTPPADESEAASGGGADSAGAGAGAGVGAGCVVSPAVSGPAVSGAATGAASGAVTGAVTDAVTGAATTAAPGAASGAPCEPGSMLRTSTMAVPLRNMSSLDAAVKDRSMIRLPTNGPRSLRRTTMLRPFCRLVTRT